MFQCHSWHPLMSQIITLKMFFFQQDKRGRLESLFITVADNHRVTGAAQSIKERKKKKASWHFTYSFDMSVDQSTMGVDLVNKHVSDGGILGVAPAVRLKWLWRISRQTWQGSACVCFGRDLFQLHSAAPWLPLWAPTCCFRKCLSVTYFLAKSVRTETLAHRGNHPCGRWNDPYYFDLKYCAWGCTTPQ